MTDPIVFIVQDPPYVRNRAGQPVPKDLSSAQRYGRIETILGSADQASQMPGPCYFTLRKALQGFRPDDYICFAGGDPMSLALAMLTLLDLGFREVQTLRWDRERDTEGNRKPGGFYVPVTIPLRP